MIDKAAIIEAYRARVPVKVIAADHGISGSHVSSIAILAGLRRRKKVSPNSAPRDKIGAAFAAGVSVKQICARYRVSRQRIYQIADEMGLPRRKRGRRPAQ